MNNKWNFWNVTVFNGKRIVDLQDPIAKIATEWLNNQIKNLIDPTIWFSERGRGLLSWDIESINSFTNSQILTEEIKDLNYKVECLIRSLIKDCIIDIEKK